MKGWNWKRLGCLVGGVVVGGIGIVFPPAAIYTSPIAVKLLIAGGAGMLVGVAIRTPGHVPAAVPAPPDELVTEVLEK